MNGGRWRKPALQLGPDVLDRHLRNVPLREHDERRALRLPGDVGDGEVAARRSPRSRRSGRARRRPARRPRARAAPSSTRSPAAACACGAGRRCRPAGTSRPSRSSTVSIASRVVPGTSETITRSAPSERVQERRLADVRPAEDRDADRLVARDLAAAGLVPRAARRPRRAGRRCRGRAARERQRVAEAEPVELERERLLARVVDLVREHEHRLVRVAEDRRRAPRRPASRPRARRRRRGRGRPRRPPRAPARRSSG